MTDHRSKDHYKLFGNRKDSICFKRSEMSNWHMSKNSARQVMPQFRTKDAFHLSKPPMDSELSFSAAAFTEMFCASRSFICRSACSRSHWLMPMMMSSMVPVVPKKTSGAKDFFFMPAGIATRAPTTEKNQVPNALHECEELHQQTISPSNNALKEFTIF
jgi:hypothetical protein